MKAPDKIYVEVCEDGIFAFPEPPFAESVEYIRADINKQPVEIHIDNPNIEKIDPSVKVENRTDGTGDIDGKASKEQPVTDCHDLDSEIFFWQKAHANEDTAQVIAMTARHFAEWGAEHLKK